MREMSFHMKMPKKRGTKPKPVVQPEVEKTQLLPLIDDFEPVIIPEPQVIIQRGEQGERGPIGERGPQGRTGDTRVSMGNRMTIKRTIDYIPVINVIFHNDIREINIAVNGTCDFRLVDLLTQKTVAQQSVENDELTVESIREFTSLPESSTVLQLQVRSEATANIEAVEFVM